MIDRAVHLIENCVVPRLVDAEVRIAGFLYANQRLVADAGLVIEAKLGDLDRHAKPGHAGRERAPQIVIGPMIEAGRLDRRARVGMAAQVQCNWCMTVPQLDVKRAGLRPNLRMHFALRY